MRFHWYCSLWKDKAKSQSACSVNTARGDTRMDLHRSGKDTAKYAWSSSWICPQLLPLVKDSTSALVFPAVDAMSKRLNGAPRSKGFRWRKVSHRQTYSGHGRGMKPQTPLPREEWMNLRENIVRKLQIPLDCLLCVGPVFTHVFPLSCFYSKPPGWAALEGMLL